jgi:hypothetical protein
VVADRRPTLADPDEVREQIGRIWQRLRDRDGLGEENGDALRTRE